MEEDKVINDTLVRAGLIIGAVSLLLLVTTFAYYLGFRQGSMTAAPRQMPNDSSQIIDQENDSQDDEAVFCTLDAKQCPDGSWVGRVPPDCEFEACPGGNDNETEDPDTMENDQDDASVEFDSNVELFPM
jgi:hypothetical protein